jgi:hypothetical protein
VGRSWIGDRWCAPIVSQQQSIALERQERLRSASQVVFPGCAARKLTNAWPFVASTCEPSLCHVHRSLRSCSLLRERRALYTSPNRRHGSCRSSNSGEARNTSRHTGILSTARGRSACHGTPSPGLLIRCEELRQRGPPIRWDWMPWPGFLRSVEGVTGLGPGPVAAVHAQRRPIRRERRVPGHRGRGCPRRMVLLHATARHGGR